MAQAITRALFMSADERRARWTAMIGKLRTNSAQKSFADFVAALARTPRPHAGPQPALIYRLERSAARLS